MKITNSEDFKTFKIGDRFCFGTRSVWEILEIKKNGLIMGMWHKDQTFSHKHLLEWNYFESFIKEYKFIEKI